VRVKPFRDRKVLSMRTTVLAAFPVRERSTGIVVDSDHLSGTPRAFPQTFPVSLGYYRFHRITRPRFGPLKPFRDPFNTRRPDAGVVHPQQIRPASIRLADGGNPCVG
jgi:hypothetical protein